MTQEIIEMAKNSGASKDGKLWLMYSEDLVAFAKLVAAKATDEANARSNTSWTLMCKKMVEDEREACLKICEAQASTNYWEGADICADAIRARGETTLRGEA